MEHVFSPDLLALPPTASGAGGVRGGGHTGSPATRVPLSVNGDLRERVGAGVKGASTNISLITFLLDWGDLNGAAEPGHLL